MKTNFRFPLKVLASVVAVAATFVVGPAVLERWNYATSDGITRAEIDTSRKLANYERTGDSTELRAWIMAGPTEAPGKQIMLTLGNWSLTHQKLFEALLAGLTPQQQRNFADKFGDVANQSSFGAPFRRAFEASDSQVIQQLRRKLA